MALMFASLVGALYAIGLWAIAAAVARGRELLLGSLPNWILALCAIAGAGAIIAVPAPLALPAGAALIGTIVCALVDARTGLIFDALSLTMAVVAVSFAIVDRRLGEDLVAAAAIGAALLALYLLSGRRGLGLGDVKLSSALALGYGLAPAGAAIGSAFVLGGMYAAALLVSRRAKRTDAVRFGPFIAGGAAVGLGANALGWLW